MITTEVVVKDRKASRSSHHEMARIIAVLSYFTFVGWLIALLIYGQNKSVFARYHLRQSLGILITFCLLSLIPLVGWLLTVLVVVAWCYGVFSALTLHKYRLPYCGDFYQSHLSFIS